MWGKKDLSLCIKLRVLCLSAASISRPIWFNCSWTKSSRVCKQKRSTFLISTVYDRHTTTAWQGLLCIKSRIATCGSCEWSKKKNIMIHSQWMQYMLVSLLQFTHTFDIHALQTCVRCFFFCSVLFCFFCVRASDAYSVFYDNNIHIWMPGLAWPRLYIYVGRCASVRICECRLLAALAQLPLHICDSWLWRSYAEELNSTTTKKTVSIGIYSVWLKTIVERVCVVFLLLLCWAHNNKCLSKQNDHVEDNLCFACCAALGHFANFALGHFVLCEGNKTLLLLLMTNDEFHYFWMCACDRTMPMIVSRPLHGFVQLVVRSENAPIFFRHSFIRLIALRYFHSCTCHCPTQPNSL